MKTAVIYARYSSDNQTEQSIEGQLRVCEQYAQNNDILILNTYIDRAMTGTNDNRPDFQQMIKDSNKKEFEFVLVYKIDRFSRNKYETAKYKKILKDNDVKLLSAMENIPDTPEGIILESLLEGMAEYYSAELAQKVKRGMHETRLKGYFQGGTLPYGYKLNGRKIEVDEDKREIVKYIFNQYATGKYVSQIIKELTSQNIFNNKGKPFLANAIYGILNNQKYTGVYIKDNETYTNMFPRIITDEIYEKVRSKRKQNVYGKRSIQTTYLLRNKLVCGYCGKPISAETGTSRLGKKINYYKCIGIKKYHNGCIKETIKQEVLEEFILDAIIKALNTPKNIDTIVKGILDAQNNKNKLQSSLNVLMRNKKQLETTLQNILSAIEQGVVNKTTNSRMQELEKQIDLIDRQILIEKSKMSIKITEEEIRKFYNEALQKEPLTLINYLVKEIKLYNDKVEITFNSPTLKSPDNQGFSFLSETLKMKKLIQNKPIPEMVDMLVKFYI